MRRLDITQTVRNNTRDLTNSVFRLTDIVMFINEGVDRMKQIIPQLDGMLSLDVPEQVPNILPSKYHHLLALYATSRCFGQDERHYQATNFMNEFEVKVDEFRSKVENGEIVLLDGTGIPIEDPYTEDYVDLSYFKKVYTDPFEA